MTTTHQISLQSPLLGQSTFPVHIQGRKIGPIVRPGHMEYTSQYQSDFQASGWNQVLKTDPDKRSQGINKYTQTVQKDNVPGWQSTMHQHPKPRWVKQEMTILGRKSTVKFDGGTVTRVKCPSSLSREVRHAFLSSQMSYLPPPKSLVKRVKGKCPSSTLRVFKAKLQTETTSKQFFQDCRTQPQVCYGDLHHRGYDKPLLTALCPLKSVGSQAPPQDQTTTRTSYMPLFSERLNLCKLKVNSSKWEPNKISLLSKGKHSDQSSCLKAGSRSTFDKRTQNPKKIIIIGRKKSPK
ncbi:uncharacterized protein LOC122201430 isoform X2 [Panthera leo]|uniref:uncharacterized protein LOC122201430 isoform X2 n=1 Tax=Panthera leo TaxID=9689 RepID=UPI001C69EF06|nr:uncharacterized protein LOC122201430 isoform X2 [Panthera leo]XP_042763229.1 uncharacterized protein LOC122201430 isoform X2 [Panthera leo]